MTNADPMPNENLIRAAIPRGRERLDEIAAILLAGTVRMRAAERGGRRSGSFCSDLGESVDVVVVYKIDRLSRSLFDFAKLVEVFDRSGVTLVSVTQHFNTTTSMGGSR